MELYRLHRPRRFDGVFGQEHITKPLLRMLKKKTVPHAILFTGPSGCGKTTIARILAKKLNCGPLDLSEINAAQARGIDEVRAMDRGIDKHPIGGDVRVWIWDEAHKLTNDAQSALLKVLEEAPEHAYVFLCTTVPNKVIVTVRNRCHPLAVKPLDEGVLAKLVQDVAAKEGTELADKVASHIANHCQGSARIALVMLEKVINAGEDIKAQMDSVLEAETEQEAFELVRMLIWKQASWKEISEFLKSFKESGANVEDIRHLILACASTELLKGGKFAERAYNVINAFRDGFYDSHFPGLVASCYEVACPNR